MAISDGAIACCGSCSNTKLFKVRPQGWTLNIVIKTLLRMLYSFIEGLSLRSGLASNIILLLLSISRDNKWWPNDFSPYHPVGDTK